MKASRYTVLVNCEGFFESYRIDSVAYEFIFWLRLLILIWLSFVRVGLSVKTVAAIGHLSEWR